MAWLHELLELDHMAFEGIPKEDSVPVNNQPHSVISSEHTMVFYCRCIVA